jgi:L-seryl-tRNA(Ser) seleniumtransferase
MSDFRSQLPAVHVLLAKVQDLPHAAALAAARAVLNKARREGLAGDWEAAIRDEVERATAPHLRRVINATGVVLHTNLGRAPLSARAAAAVAEVASGYSNLELDLESGARGERLAGVAPRLQRMFDVEGALAVNNCAAAVLLALSALAAGKEVIVSRGELVEIGGSFRIPDVITSCGARLVEVGTTNRTRVADYERAITAETAVILRVHPSNFHVEGFTEAADRAELAALAHRRGLLYVDDLGSGAREDRPGEPSVATVARAGADVVCFSGDKLFGGPQAGIVIGRAAPLARMRKHPLYRALRLDRLVLAALEATLIGIEAGEELPVDTMLRHTEKTLRARAASLAAAIGPRASLIAANGLPGGGSLPAVRLQGAAVAVAGHATQLVRALRAGPHAVVARVENETVILDLLTVQPTEDQALCNAVIAAIAAYPPAK